MTETNDAEITPEMREENALRAHPLSEEGLATLAAERARRRALKARWEVFTDAELAILAEALTYVAFGNSMPADEIAKHIEFEQARRGRVSIREPRGSS